MMIYLASISPQRKTLMAQLGLEFQLLNIAIDETPLSNEPPEVYAKRIALEKCHAGLAQITQGIVIAADTCVVVDQQILGKPDNAEHAQSMLRLLSGKKHVVISAVALGNQQQQQCVLNRNEVYFADLGDEDIADYIASGEYKDKAGAYGIQGKAAAFIKEIQGSYTGIVGLPLYETKRLLKQFI